MKVLVLNDGETFTSIGGCQIVEVPDDYSNDEIEESIKILNRHQGDLDDVKILGGFDNDGCYHVGDPRDDSEKKKIVLE